MGVEGMIDQSHSTGEQQIWLQEVLHLLPFPTILIEPETARVLFTNRAATGIPIAGPDPGADRRAGPSATDEHGNALLPEQMPHRRAARGERLDGLQVSWKIPEGEVTFL